MNDIKKILIDGQGWKYYEEGKFEFYDLRIGENDYMPWIRQITSDGIKEFNIRYVVQIEYFDDSTQQLPAKHGSAVGR